jgi:hypothetical protein
MKQGSIRGDRRSTAAIRARKTVRPAVDPAPFSVPSIRRACMSQEAVGVQAFGPGAKEQGREVAEELPNEMLEALVVVHGAPPRPSPHQVAC